jgi:hypothetical protein
MAHSITQCSRRSIHLDHFAAKKEDHVSQALGLLVYPLRLRADLIS